MHTLTRIPACRPSHGPADPFADRFGCPMPRELRAQSAGMSWTDFVDRYSPSSGDLALASWSRGLPAGGCAQYDALLEVAGCARAFRASGPGPIAALTSMLHDAGRSIEILSFHQRTVAEGTATFVHCEHEVAGTGRWRSRTGRRTRRCAR